MGLPRCVGVTGDATLQNSSDKTHAFRMIPDVPALNFRFMNPSLEAFSFHGDRPKGVKHM